MNPASNIGQPLQLILAENQHTKQGSYRLEIPLNTKTPNLKFFQNGKLVATAPARVKSETHKADSTEIHYRHEGKTQYITEVVPGGMKEALVLTKSGNMKSGS